MYIGIVEVLFLITFFNFLVSHMFRSRIETALWERDLLAEQEVHPRLYGILYYASVAAINGGAAIVSFVTNNDLVAVALLVGCALFGFLLLKLLRTGISYDEETLIVRDGKKASEIPIAAIQQIRWIYVRHTIGPSLTIYLWGGSKIVLHHMDYIGLRKMANFFYLKFGDNSGNPIEHR